IGGTAAGARNLISGNNSYGVHIGRDPASPFVIDVPRDNRVQGNYIGTDVTGTMLLSNATGVFINGGSNNLIGGIVAGARNLISGNTNSGVRILSGWASGNQVQGNYIGPNAAGTAAIGNGTGVSVQDSPNNIIGEKLGTGGNVIAASEGDGVNIFGSGATGNRVIGNYIGTNAAGTAALGNAAGVLINGAPNNWIGGMPSGDRNIISGNRASGVVLMGDGATGNRVQNNLIGTQANGSSALGNSSHGVWLTSSARNNTIGGLADGAGNTIAFNGGDGVYVESGTGNAILSNSIFSNGGLGIDLGPNGVTLNDLGDLDVGANNLQNFPEGFIVGSDINRISGEVRNTPNTTFTLQFFTNSALDPSGYGEGQRLIQTLTVTTDATGLARYSFFYDSFDGEWITATMTDAANNTSEFSAGVRAGPRI
ncbi:MAG: hypothetical protein L0Z62_24015, partial [Gemmataceae bacterium]|nr:hypothetical protein [Gemmataceae bacterium]